MARRPRGQGRFQSGVAPACRRVHGLDVSFPLPGVQSIADNGKAIHPRPRKLGMNRPLWELLVNSSLFRVPESVSEAAHSLCVSVNRAGKEPDDHGSHNE